MAKTMLRALAKLRAYWRAENSTPEGQWSLIGEVIVLGLVLVGVIVFIVHIL
jgi:hypothetical protein